MNHIRAFFNPSTLPCNIDKLSPSIVPSPPNTQFEYNSTILDKISLSHIFNLNPSHYQFSTILSTKSSILNISHESSATHFRFIHNLKDVTMKLVALFSKKDGAFAQTEILYYRPSYQINFKQVLPAFDNRQIYILNLFKSINKKLCIGLEAVCDGKGFGGSLYGRIDIGTILYGRIDRDEIKLGLIKRINMFTLGYELRKGAETVNAVGVKLQTKKANVHVGFENLIGRIEIEQGMGQSVGVKFGSEIDLKTGKQSFGISLNLEN